VLTLVRQARRRLFCNEFLLQGGNTVSAAMALLILFLLSGVQVLNWPWLLLFPLGAVAWAFVLASRRVPDSYVTAQLIDRRLGLPDVISTAFYFQTAPASRNEQESIRRFQFEIADRAARSMDVRRAVPYTVPRRIYLMAVLTLLASSLFAWRYGLTRSLDLRPPLARILEQVFPFPKSEPNASRGQQRRVPRVPGEELESEILSEAEQAMIQTDRAPLPPSSALPAAKTEKRQNPDTANGPAPVGDPLNGAFPSEPEGDSSLQSASASPGGDASKRNGSPQDASRSDGNTANSSLLSKVKDAMQNLLSRMKSPPGSNGRQPTGESNKQSANGQRNGARQDSAANGQQQQAGGQPRTSNSEEQAGGEAADAQDAEEQSASAGHSQQIGKRPGSGVGSQDGDKKIKQAEQLAAMGKISEIIGKRAANVSGETTVEVQNTTQVLHTPYAPRASQHSEIGAEIHRDEIPVALENYVEQYFEQVRRLAPAAKSDR
jgi:hypothetical protein